LFVQGRITLKKDLLETRLQEVAASVREAGEHLTESLQPYVRPANLQRLNDTMNYFGNPEVSRTLTLATIPRERCLTGVCCGDRSVDQVLMRVLLDEAYEPDLDVLMIAAKHYAQFVFYEEDITPMARRLTMAL
jgi:hypothetical protein